MFTELLVSDPSVSYIITNSQMFSFLPNGQMLLKLEFTKLEFKTCSIPKFTTIVVEYNYHVMGDLNTVCRRIMLLNVN